MQAAEMAAGCMILIPLILYAVDAGTIFLGQSSNASICRDACRAAASGPPSAYTTAALGPEARAKRVISDRYDPKSIIRIDPAKAIVTETLQDPKPVAPFGGPVKGEIKVQTTALVYPPFSLPAIQQEVTLVTESSFPITWVMPADYSVSAGASDGRDGGATPVGPGNDGNVQDPGDSGGTR
jgi:hypothetical protein